MVGINLGGVAVCAVLSVAGEVRVRRACWSSERGRCWCSPPAG